MSAAFVSPPKSTMLLMVEATEAFSCVMMKTPRKLKMAAMMTAECTRMHRGGDAGGDGVGCVGPAVDEDDSQRQQRCDGQSRVGKHLLEEMRQ